jgi:TatD DNase family protein
VVEVAKTLAGVYGVSLEEIAQRTTDNCQRLFRLGPYAHHRQEVLAYAIRNSLYLNITRSCTLRCGFCPKWTAPIVDKYDLTLGRNPTAGELIKAIGDPTPYAEVVFCGYGEPTLRLPVLLEVARAMKARGKRVRLNTDGLANRVYGRDVTPELAGLIDVVSVSLNAQDQATYDRHCQPHLSGSYEAVKGFIQAAKVHVPEVVATAIQGLDGVDIDACRHIAEQELGILFRMRYLHQVG